MSVREQGAEAERMIEGKKGKGKSKDNFKFRERKRLLSAPCSLLPENNSDSAAIIFSRYSVLRP
jgi:hypothetical protein